MRKLAIHGGAPARKQPLPPNYPGAVVMGEEEAKGASEVAYSQSPFRYYGVDVKYKVQQFENLLAQITGSAYTLGVTSCTAGLVVALKALQIGYGDKVAVPAVTFIASAGAIVSVGAVPVFIDADSSLNLDPEDLERKLKEDPEIRAIITVPILGYPCDMERTLQVAAAYGVPVIEDVAQSAGSKYRGRYAGSLGNIGVYSFQMNKIITSGEGGAVMTSDPQLFMRAVRYHDQGMFREKARYGIETDDNLDAFAGQNYRMSEFTGAIVYEQLLKLESIVSRMKRVHDALRARLAAENMPGLVLRHSHDDDGIAGNTLAFSLASAELAKQVDAALHAENIQSFILYGGVPLYKNPIFRDKKTVDKNGFPYNYPFKRPVDYTNAGCPVAEDLLARTVFIPISPILSEEEVEPIAEAVISVYRTLCE